MNSLVYNPSVEVVQEWRDIYLNLDEIREFQSLIDYLYFYLEIIQTHKNNKKRKAMESQDKKGDKKTLISKEIAPNIQAPKASRFLTDNDIKLAHEKIKDIFDMRQKFQAEYNKVLKSRRFIIPDGMTRAAYLQRQKLKYLDPQKYTSIAYSKIDFDRLLEIFENHITYLERIVVQYYTMYVFEEDCLIQKFSEFKEHALRGRILRFKELVRDVLQAENRTALSQLSEDSQRDFRTLYENLYIQTDYLAKLIHTNAHIFDKCEEEHENSFEYLKEVRFQHKKQMESIAKTVERLKQELRDLYALHYKSKKTEFSDPHRIQKIICSEVAVNADQFSQTTNSDAFINGVFFSILLSSLIGIMVFRGLTLSTLQSNQKYLAQFKIWRGASYLIFMNWVIGIVLFLFDYFKINYRLVLLEADTFVPKPQAFLKTAVTLSAVYLILFLIYLFKAVGVIKGHELLHHLGYFMWLINLCFLLNPFKIMNYEGRRYFLQLFAKVLVSIFRPMNLNIFLVAMIMGSFVQPFTDLAFTACSLAYSQKRDCLEETKVATFVFTLIFLIIRFGHSIRSHSQLNTSKILTRPIIGLIAVVCSFNNVLSSYLYNIYLSNGLLVYWIISAIIATFGGMNADIRADFGLVSFDREDCMLRKYKRFPRATYFIVIVIDFFLNIGWVFSVSNNLSFADSINPIYFLMVLSYIELSRKGLWIFFRVQDDHSANVGCINAMATDQPIYRRLRERHNIIEQNNDELNDKSSDIIKQNDPIQQPHKQSPQFRVYTDESKGKPIPTLQELQEEILRKKEYKKNVNIFKEEILEYFTSIQQNYTRLEWDEEYC